MLEGLVFKVKHNQRIINIDERMGVNEENHWAVHRICNDHCDDGHACQGRGKYACC